jgi:hypothetical protein
MMTDLAGLMTIEYEWWMFHSRKISLGKSQNFVDFMV